MRLVRVATVGVSLLIAGSLQQAIAFRVSIFGARPDFILVFLCVLTPYFPRPGATLLGFLFGAIQGAIPTANLTHYIVSRSVAAFALSSAKAFRFEHTILYAVASTAAATVFAQIVWMFLAGPQNIGGFIGDTIRTAMYNGVLAAPLYALIKLIFGPTSD